MADDSSIPSIDAICATCNKPFKRKSPAQNYCSPECRKISRPMFYQKDYIKKLQENVYSFLGNKCANCGEDDSIVLTIDHIEAVGKNRKQTVQVYLDILRSPAYASQYQLLCRNCNWRKMIQKNERNPKEPEFVTYQDFSALALEVHETKTLLNEFQASVRKEITEHRPRSIQSAQALVDLVIPHLQEVTDEKGNIDARQIRFVLFDKENMRVGVNKSYDIKKLIELR